MKHPWQVWLVFVVCVGGAAGAMIWLTQQALRTDAARREAEADAALEQRVGLALWRMDTELAPIIAAEVIRAPSMYRAAFFAVQPGIALQQTLVQAPNMPGEAPPTQQAAIAVPQQAASPQASPLFVEPPPYVVCNFEATLDGRWRSPQVAERELLSLAAANGVTPQTLSERAAHLHELASAVDVAKLADELPVASLPSIADVGSNSKAMLNADSVTQFNELNRGLNYYEGNTANPRNSQFNNGENNLAPQDAGPQQQSQVKGLGKGELAQMRSADFADRTRRIQNMAQQEMLEQRQQQSQPFGNSAQVPTDEDTSAKIGVSRPMWIGQRLVLARRVEQAGKTFVQGCWLDWPKLKTRLLAEAAELVPDANLVAVPETTDNDPGRMLAGLPVRLVLNVTPAADAALSPTLRWALWIGWGSLFLAALAAAALLAGVMALSERRAAFVSSVTHELRTPLTTFRMYSEMLARGMVPDATRRQEYLHTLQREAERLTHLVENVLAYARLERGRRPSASERLTPVDFLDRIAPRLSARAAHANMQCEIDIADACADVSITTDPGVVEQILFNLVDNSAKYARAATDRRIHVAAAADDRWLKFTVSDHGPGMPPRRTSRLRPFAKTAEESAETAPGVGLGLALCSRLARQLGGRLEIAAANNTGAAVSLYLPV